MQIVRRNESDDLLIANFDNLSPDLQLKTILSSIINVAKSGKCSSINIRCKVVDDFVINSLKDKGFDIDIKPVQNYSQLYDINIKW
jgi:hypothetical protein